jgi:hypothetical protein
MNVIYASEIATKNDCRNLATRKCGSKRSVCHRRFLDLAKLVGKTLYTVVFGSRLDEIYMAKMTDSEHQILSSVIVTTNRMGHIINL